MMKHLQKLGSALMLPVATLPICGILMGLGYLLCPAYMMGAGWAESLGYATSGLAYSIGFFLIKAGGALIDNMAILFAIGTAVGLAKENNGAAGLAAIGDGGLAYSKIANPFTGILAGVLGGVCYNRFKDT